MRASKATEYYLGKVSELRLLDDYCIGRFFALLLRVLEPFRFFVHSAFCYHSFSVSQCIWDGDDVPSHVRRATPFFALHSSVHEACLKNLF